MFTPKGPVVILSGAGLSAASGVPTFRDANGLWEGYDVTQVATPAAFRVNPTLVRRFYDERRIGCGRVSPNPGHYALAQLQRAWGERLTLVTQNIDGLLQKAGCTNVIEMHGSLWKLRCAQDEHHPRVDVVGAQDPDARCGCGALMRPDIVWFGEVPFFLDEIGEALYNCQTFVSVGTSGVVYPAAGFVQIARSNGAYCLEINPKPTGGDFHATIEQGSEVALPEMVAWWLKHA